MAKFVSDERRHVDIPGPVVQHKKSKVVPRKRDSTAKCGRKTGSHCTELPEGTSFKWARCARLASTEDQMVALFDAASRDRKLKAAKCPKKTLVGLLRMRGS